MVFHKVTPHEFDKTKEQNLLFHFQSLFTLTQPTFCLHNTIALTLMSKICENKNQKVQKYLQMIDHFEADTFQLIRKWMML